MRRDEIKRGRAYRGRAGRTRKVVSVSSVSGRWHVMYEEVTRWHPDASPKISVRVVDLDGFARWAKEETRWIK